MSEKAEKSSVRKWMEILVPDFLMGTIAAIVGVKLAQEDKTPAQKTAATLGSKIGEVLAFDRGHFLHELRVINTATHGGIQPLIDLFDKIERNGGLIKIRGKWRREEWIARKLLLIPPEYRQTDYPWLAKLLKNDPVQFFSKLEILNNDGWVQIIRQVKVMAGELVKNPAVKNVWAELDNRAQNIANQLQPTRDRLRAEAQRGGWRTWLEF